VNELLSGRVVVVSPHIDDAVFSLAATIGQAARAGAEIEVLTVFALDPTSDAPANGWDTRAGFATEGEAARARRDEDREACHLVGAEPRWLQFRGSGYTKVRETEAISTAVRVAIADTDAVLVPGFPLTNPDHAWLAELLTAGSLLPGQVGLYAEQPYRYLARRERPKPELPAHIRSELRRGVEWTKMRVRLSDYRLKRNAILAYATQLPLLGFEKLWHRKLDLMLVDEALHRGEALAWLPSSEIREETAS
jgi:LmbE family N-acetylglucosaminyl deacetylase